MTTVDEAREALLLHLDTNEHAAHPVNRDMVDALIAAVRAEQPTSCPGCGHHWWAVGDDSYGCEAAQELAALREAYVEALVTAWKQAEWIASRVPNENGVGIVSNIEERFKPFIPDWREASSEAAGRALAATPAEDGEGRT